MATSKFVFQSEDNNARCDGQIDTIDKKTHEIKQDEDKVVYKTLEDIAEDLPDHSPRFVLLSYPLTLVRFNIETNTPFLPPYPDSYRRGL